MLRKVAWTLLAAAMTSVATAVALRLARTVWVRVTHEPPPRTRLTWLVLRRPMRKRILAALRARP